MTNPPDWPPARPKAVGIASALWICLGAMLALAAIYYLGTPAGMTLATGPIAPLVLCTIGVTLIVFGVRLRRGRRGARTVLTVMGCLLLIGLWTVLFVVPALVLQYRASNKEWFDAVS